MIQTTTILWQYLKTKYYQPFRTREELQRWQDKKVKAFLLRILPRSPFYRRYYQGLSIENWRDFPLIDKQIMMEHFDSLNTAGIQKEEAFSMALQAEESRNFQPMIRDITIGLSSGTSGNRGLFLVSKQERFRWAGVMLAKLLPRSLFQKHRIALFLRANSNLYSSVQYRRIQFQFFDLIQPVEQHLRPLNEYQPTILVGPPSLLRLLAEKIRAGQCSIQPERIISVTEVLEPLDRNVIEETFGQPLHQIYQATEGFLATTCEHGTLHMNEDLLVIQKEYLDHRSGKFSPIITDFHRTTQPIIRYRLNDLLVEKKEPCPCGSPLLAIETIEGRCDDIFAFPAQHQRGPVIVFPDFVRHAILSAHPAIEEYMVIQHQLDQLEISLRIANEPSDTIEQAVSQSIRKLCQKLQCQMPTINFTPYRFQAGVTKLRRIQRKFPLPTDHLEGTSQNEHSTL